jgi:iron complex outermembrane receptor protein
MSARFSSAFGIAVAVAAALPAAAQQTSVAPPAVDDVISVTGARRREEAAQDVPIPMSIVSGDLITDTGSFNVNRIKELVPTVQLYSSNPRNTGVNIRGLGAPFGLTNDGIEPGVGYYVDGVLYARPASTTLDFIDVERVEVLRGPQGTLFGKNTTAGAILVTTKKASFTPAFDFEVGYGDDNFVQAKTSVTGPLGDKVAGRLSFSGTQRDGNVYNVVTQKHVNDLNNAGFRGQLLVTPSETTDITLALDYTRQRPDGYAQVFAGVAPTLRAPARQFEQIIDAFGYEPPSRNPFDRLIDHDTPWRSGNEIGGLSLNVDTDVGPGTLRRRRPGATGCGIRRTTETSHLPVALSRAVKHEQLTEIRWAGDLSSNVNGVFGFTLSTSSSTRTPSTPRRSARRLPLHMEPVAVQQEPDNAQGPEDYDGQTRRSRPSSTPSARRYSASSIGRSRTVCTCCPACDSTMTRKTSTTTSRPSTFRRHARRPRPTAIKRSSWTWTIRIHRAVTLAFDATEDRAYATYSTAFKSVGVNLGGIPNIPAGQPGAGQPDLSLAEIEPEDVSHFEIGLKTRPTPRSTANVTLFNTEIEDYQTNVVDTSVANTVRGYIANAEKVRVRGIEFDGSARIGASLSLHGALAYPDGEYVSFDNAPPPLELTGLNPAVVDATGGRLPGLSEWAASFGGEHNTQVNNFLGKSGELFTGFDLYYRGDFSSNPTPSQYLNVDAYSLLNLRVGFRSNDGWSGYLWVRNALDEEYFEQVAAAPAGQGAGHYGAVLGDPRTYGLTLRLSF